MHSKKRANVHTKGVTGLFYTKFITCLLPSMVRFPQCPEGWAYLCSPFPLGVSPVNLGN